VAGAYSQRLVLNAALGWTRREVAVAWGRWAGDCATHRRHQALIRRCLTRISRRLVTRAWSQLVWVYRVAEERRRVEDKEAFMAKKLKRVEGDAALGRNAIHYVGARGVASFLRRCEVSTPTAL